MADVEVTAGEEVRPDIVWMTYAEGAKTFGVDAESFARRVRARKWRKQPGNDGRARVAVPGHLVEGAANKKALKVEPDSAPDSAQESPPESVPESPPASAPEMGLAIKAMEAVAENLRDQVEKLSTDLAEARQEAKQAVLDLTAERVRAATIEGERNEARRLLEAAQASLTQVRARSLWDRLLNR